MDEFKKNPINYIKNKYNFLLERNYILSELHKNVEMMFVFKKENIKIVINVENENVNCYFSNSKYSNENIKSLVGDLLFKKDYDILIIIDKIDYLASLIINNLYKIEELTCFRIMSSDDLNYYTEMLDVFKRLDLNDKNYKWLISDFEIYPQIEEINKIFKDKNELILSTKELLEILNKEDFQWIWGVLAAIPDNISNEKIINGGIPCIRCINDYNPFIDKPKLQNKYSILELYSWDSNGLFLITKYREIIENFKKSYPLSIEE